jgi:hypothetical protein
MVRVPFATIAVGWIRADCDRLQAFPSAHTRIRTTEISHHPESLEGKKLMRPSKIRKQAV